MNLRRTLVTLTGAGLLSGTFVLAEEAPGPASSIPLLQRSLDLSREAQGAIRAGNPDVAAKLREEAVRIQEQLAGQRPGRKPAPVINPAPKPAAPGKAADPAEIFLEAFQAFVRGTELEKKGDLPTAHRELRESQELLDKITAQWPAWNPTIVAYRQKKVDEVLQRVQMLVPELAPPQPLIP